MRVSRYSPISTNDMPRRNLLVGSDSRNDRYRCGDEASGLITTGRGWEVFDHPVSLEPAASGFSNAQSTHCAAVPAVIDDGRYPGLLERRLLPKRSEIQCPPDSHSTIRPRFLEPAPTSFPVVELQVSLPETSVVTAELMERLLLNIARRSVPSAFEIVGNDEQVIVQFAVRESDADHTAQQIKSHFSECTVSRGNAYLKSLFEQRGAGSPNSIDSLVVDFGLSRECLCPLLTPRSFEPDPLIGLIGSLSDLNRGEALVLQALFQTTRERWNESFLNALTDENGAPRFRESKDLLTHAKQKFSRPLLAVSLRCGVMASSQSRALQIARGLAGTLQTLASPNGNDLIALQELGLEPADRIDSLIHRISYRKGMLLNVSELAGLAHFPSASVKSSVLKREQLKTKAAPAIASGHSLVLGENYHRGERRQVSLSEEQRTRHIHLIGQTGSGKSTLLLSLIKQDLDQNQGLCVIDPHGDLIDLLVKNVPENRLNDVILFDASDADYPIGFNILQARSGLERTILSSDLVATFRRMSTSWGDVMDSVLANAILAFVESSRGGSLFELKRFLVEKDFRTEYLKSVTDEAIVYFWENEFPLIAGKPQASILIRLDAFLRQSLIRNIVCQKENKLDFRSIMDDRKILLIKLSQGLIGEENAYLLGTMLVSRLYQAALSRQDSQDRPYFWLYLDEFHHFITPSMERILSGTRKYNLGLILAHQEFRQMQARSQEVASSVLSNCYTRICFRLGDNDAEKFAGGFSFFDGKALQNLGVGEAIARVERADFDFNLSVNQVSMVTEELSRNRINAVTNLARRNFGRQKAEVEAGLRTVRIEAAVPRSKTQQQDFQVQDDESPGKTPPQRPKEPLSPDTSEHRYLQNIVKRIGEDKGFVATLEKAVFGGVGKVDVALENGGVRIACEIAVTNAAEYEIQNIHKCLSSGFDRMAVISIDTRHLQNIKKRAELVLSSVHMSRIHFLEPENFHLFLDYVVASHCSPIDKPQKFKGYTVKTSCKDISEADAASKRQIIGEIISRVTRRRKRSRDREDPT